LINTKTKSPFYLGFTEHWFIERSESIGYVPLSHHFIKSDRLGEILLENKTDIPEGIYAMLRRVADTRLRNALPSSLDEMEQTFQKYSANRTARASCPNSIRSPEWLRQNGYCVDRLYAANSTIPAAGRGAFTKIAFRQNEVISVSPVIHFKLADLQPERQERDERTGKPYFTGKLGPNQLVTNYAFGHRDSDVVFVAYAPIVNLINHSSEPNASIRWSTSKHHQKRLLQMDAVDLLEEKTGLMIEYVALRDIGPGEEIFIDYGTAWEEALNAHYKGWEKNKQIYSSMKDYISAEDWNRIHVHESIRTILEQEKHPYPINLQTVCFYSDDRTDDEQVQETQEVVQDEYGMQIHIVRRTLVEDQNGCLRPCTILNREIREDGVEVYKAVMGEIQNEGVPPFCWLDPSEKHIVTNITRSKIQLGTVEYASDLFLDRSFRHMIYVPEGMFPDNWMRPERSKEGDFQVIDMAPLEITHFKWNDTGEIVSEYGLEISVPENVTKTLRDFCDRTGITKKFRQLELEQPLDVGTDEFTTLGGMQWYIQRPESHWKSNMHWISPGDAESHEDYLRALGEGGFGDVLQSIAENLELKGLVCFHVTFIGVSKCDKGYIHYDFTQTGGSGFNVIIPLILASDSPPELYVRDDQNLDRIGAYKYRIGYASVLGDDTFHGTAEVDYLQNQEFRMAATIYIADVNEDNVDAIMKDYTQFYPPKDPAWLLSQAGAHWGKGSLPIDPKGLRI